QAEIVARGHTEPLRRVEVRARTAGIVEEVTRREGDTVRRGDLICRLDMAARKARLAEQKANLASAQTDYEAASELARQQFAAESRKVAEKARLDAARAAVEQMELEIRYTSIEAPVDGTVEQRPAEPGSFPQVGDLCAVISVLDPMLVIAHVGERQIGAVREGMAGEAHLITGQAAQGTIRFVAPAADPATRTFRVELEVPNPDRTMRSGVTAELRIPLPSQPAHRLPQSVLVLGDDGEIGVRTVDDGNAVRFRPVEIKGQTADGVWVEGLPEEVTIITVGQEYVVEGQTVDPVLQEAAGLARSDGR